MARKSGFGKGAGGAKATAISKVAQSQFGRSRAPAFNKAAVKQVAAQRKAGSGKGGGG